MAPRQTPKKDDKAKDKPKAEKPADEAKKDDTVEEEKAEDQEESQEDDSEQEDTDESDAEDGEDEGSEDKTVLDPAAETDPETGLQKARVTNSQVEPAKAAPKPNRVKVDNATAQAASDKPDDMSDSYLDSPQRFGIWIDGALVQFNKGKTRLTNKQKAECLVNRYVADNGAHVAKLVRAKK